MKERSIRGLGLQAAAVLALAGSGSAHSWIEMAYRIAPNGTMVGNPGFPRGYVPRNSTDPVFTDDIPVWLLPSSGQSAYSGDEILNKFPKQDQPAHPMLEASPGDYIVLTHLENGHTTLPQNQPLKPHNRGTIYFYGTSQPNDKERLFDVHLVWNKDGTGGDRRGRLLGTRNYDDGQCYQPNDGALSLARAAALEADGASHDIELPCQSDLQLPTDLQPGSIYTIYWYWDWPDLDAEHMDVDATTDGIYPWAGTFMRSNENVDAHGFSMAGISKNESYASTIDIRITDDSTLHNDKQGDLTGYIDKQNVYTKAIKSQLENNFQVDIDAEPGTTGATAADTQPESTGTMTMTSSEMPSVAPTTSVDGQAPGFTATATSFETVWSSTTWKTVTRTASATSLSSSDGGSEPLNPTPVPQLPTAVPEVAKVVPPQVPSLPDRVSPAKAGYAGY